MHLVRGAKTGKFFAVCSDLSSADPPPCTRMPPPCRTRSHPLGKASLASSCKVILTSNHAFITSSEIPGTYLKQFTISSPKVSLWDRLRVLNSARIGRVKVLLQASTLSHATLVLLFNLKNALGLCFQNTQYTYS